MKYLHSITILFFLIHSLAAQDTFSIVAMDPETGEVGSAGASCVDLSNFFGLSDHFLGDLVPGQAAINTQAYYLSTNQNNALQQIQNGASPQETIDWLIANDVQGNPALRQYGIVALTDNGVESAAHTGQSTDDYKGHIVGPNYAIQGNILLNEEVLLNMEQEFLNAEGDLACKLMAAMQGANIVGADSRCADNGTSSLFAFLKVAQADDVQGNPGFLVSVRTKNGDGIEPIDSLQVLFDAEKSCSPSSLIQIDGQSLSLYPNPFSDSLELNYKGTDEVEIVIFNTEGREVFKDIIRSSSVLDTTDWKAGVYQVLISVDGEVQSFKTIKIK